MKANRPCKVEKTVPDYEPDDVELQRQAILEYDLYHDDDVDDMDALLAEQCQMQCSNWERAQDAYPVIKCSKELMREFGDVAPNRVQLST